MTDHRTFDPLAVEDLKEIQHFADIELRRFVEEVGQPPGKYRGYRDRLLAVCLVQGAAQHFVDTRLPLPVDHEIEVDQTTIERKGYSVANDGRVINGVKDIDVLFMFESDAAVPIPQRRHCCKSVECDLAALNERRFDFMKKGLQDDTLGPSGTQDIRGVVRRYIELTEHGRSFLAKKSIIGLNPPHVFGHSLWATQRWAEGHLARSGSER